MSLDPRTDPPRDEDWALETHWPDPDRREGAVVRLLARVLGDRAYTNRRQAAGGHGSYPFTPFAGREPGELLTRRQKEVLTCASHGLGVIETADALGIHAYTVSQHRRRAQALLQGNTLEHAVANAIRRGIIR